MAVEAERRSNGFASLPQEVFDAIAEHISVVDKRALTTVSKAIRVLAEPTLFSTVSLNNKYHFFKVSHVLASKPHLCKAVRTYRVTGDVGWWCLDPLDQLKSLRKFSFRPSHDELAPREPTIHMLEKLATGKWIHRALKICFIQVLYSELPDIPVELRERVLCAVMSTPSLDSLTALYVKDWKGWIEPDYEFKPVQPRCPPLLQTTKITALRFLRLRWDGAPLSWISELLRLPRRLEALHLQFSLRYSLMGLDVFMTLDAALEPVADTLITLTVLPVLDFDDETDNETYMEDVGCRWSNCGLRGFKKLENLGLPGSSLEEFRRLMSDHGYGGQNEQHLPEKSLELPATLKTLYLNDAWLVRMSTTGYSPFRDELRAMEALTLDWQTADHLKELCRVLQHSPELKLVKVNNMNSDVDLDELRQNLPPVYLEQALRPLFDRGVKVAIDSLKDDTLQLPTCLEDRDKNLI